MTISSEITMEIDHGKLRHLRDDAVCPDPFWGEEVSIEGRPTGAAGVCAVGALCARPAAWQSRESVYLRRI